MRRKGVSGTGMREIVTEADAPRGSLQHYFPRGTDRSDEFFRIVAASGTRELAGIRGGD